MDAPLFSVGRIEIGAAAAVGIEGAVTMLAVCTGPGDLVTTGDAEVIALAGKVVCADPARESTEGKSEAVEDAAITFGVADVTGAGSDFVAVAIIVDGIPSTPGVKLGSIFA